MRTALILSFSAACVSMPLSAQVAPQEPAPAAEAQTPMDKTKAQEVVRELATQLEANFVFPETGEAYAAMLRSNLEAGAYDGFTDAKAFAEEVTADLQAVHEDRHLRVHLVPEKARSGPAGERRGPADNLNAISKSGWLADGVAYVRFEGFPGTDATMAALKQFLAAHKDAGTLIIDARAHRGGGLSEMDMLFPAIFDKPTVLVGMDTRVAVEESRGSPMEDAMLRKVAGPDGVVRREHYVNPAARQGGLAKAKVYLLTSNRTASAGEHLSLSLKRTKRATLIGETTRGAGHYGGMVPLDKDFTFAAFIPVGRTFDPDTNEGWEGSGVKPDVEVPADKALDEALRLAGVSVSGEVALAQLK